MLLVVFPRQDIEFEMDRFNNVFEENASKYTYMDRPKGSLQERAEVAVDSLARLCLKAADGDVLDEEDAALIEDVVVDVLSEDNVDFRSVVKTAIHDRPNRKEKYSR